MDDTEGSWGKLNQIRYMEPYNAYLFFLDVVLLQRGNTPRVARRSQNSILFKRYHAQEQPFPEAVVRHRLVQSASSSSVLIARDEPVVERPTKVSESRRFRLLVRL